MLDTHHTDQLIQLRSENRSAKEVPLFLEVSMRRAPSIQSWMYGTDGSLTVSWDVDTFFSNSEQPDTVDIEINNLLYKGGLSGSARSFEVPEDKVAPLPGTVIVFAVAFVWSGDPRTVERASVLIPLPGRDGQVADRSVKAPSARIEAIEPKTLNHANRITIFWSGFSYNEGKVSWGRAGQATREHTFKPGRRGTEPDYTGRFTTNIELEPGALFEFRVYVKNTFVSQDYSPPAIMSVLSARNFNSLRQFLTASGGAPVRSLRPYFELNNSLRRLMGV